VCGERACGSRAVHSTALQSDETTLTANALPPLRSSMRRLKSVALSLFAAAAIATVVVGCGGDDRPVAEGTSDDASREQPLVEPQTFESEPQCTPRQRRECWRYWIGFGHVPLCEKSIQYCRADRTGWHPCGELNPKDEPVVIPRAPADDGGSPLVK
jgi:hypothetical protein